MSDIENLKRQLAYTFLDAYGNFDGADILFDSIVKATEDRIIKLLDQKHIPHDGDKVHNESGNCTACEIIAFIKGENK